jgi:beta-glucosidase-like glycosyl hydrolase
MGNVMVSYSAVNNICMSINAPLLQGVLKDGIFDGRPFEGFAISDYDAIGKVSAQLWPSTNIKMTTEDAVVNVINAGIDMAMLSSGNPNLPPLTF